MYYIVTCVLSIVSVGIWVSPIMAQVFIYVDNSFWYRAVIIMLVYSPFFMFVAMYKAEDCLRCFNKDPNTRFHGINLAMYDCR